MALQTPVRTSVTVGAVAMGVGLITGLLGPGHAEEVYSSLSTAAQSEITQAGFFFALAAWLHAGRVKKEIKLNFASLTTAINQVADAFRADLRAHGLKLDNLANRVQSLESKTSNLKLGD